MNILYITNHLNIGGITSYVLKLASGLKEKGHDIYVASSGGELLSKFIDAGINYIHLPIKTKQEVSLEVIFSFFKLTQAVKEKGIDIIHTNSRVTQVLGCLLKKNTGAAHISTCHGFFKRRIIRRIFPCWGDRVIAISQEVRGHLVKDFKVDESKIRVIYHGVDAKGANRNQCAETRAEIKKKLGLSDGPVVGIVARLSDVKGHIYLIQAMQEVLKVSPQAQLLIAGEGPMKEELVGLVRRLRITKNVFFIPSIPDTKELLSAMDLFVLPSLKEGLGLSLMEAMAEGLAVIGSDVGGIRSLIKDKENGYLFMPQDAAGLSVKILDLLNNPEKRSIFGLRARNFIMQNFSQEKMVQATEKVYEECLSVKS